MAEAMKQENITLDEVCAAVKRFGFDGVELDANRLKNEVGTILPALQKAGLSVNGIYNFSISAAQTVRRKATARRHCALYGTA